MSRGAIVVFAKAPRPGRVKTRLQPKLDAHQAAELQAAMLADVLEVTARIGAGLDLDPVLAIDPWEARGEIARAAPAAFRVVAQRGGDLGERLERAAAEAAAAGARPILLRGSDSPTLAAADVRALLEALADRDLALRPDPDGGYGLVGLWRPQPGLFRHPMSTASVLADTRARAEAAGLRVGVTAPGFDIDTPADLRRLARARRAGDAAGCPRTLAYLDERRLW